MSQWQTVVVQLRFNYRVYPTSGQQQALARAFGCARVVFNDGLRTRQQAQAAGLPYVTDAELSRQVTAAKLTPQRVAGRGVVGGVAAGPRGPEHRLPQLLHLSLRQA
ncbi:helix-turn-helix domain-containing protein [Micromonospora noduli]|uniref:helix-turn-helix domain-containing protein n=1 Tax=Micromonospora noduli TaxID=709876 RepID=UPI001C65D280